MRGLINGRSRRSFALREREVAECTPHIIADVSGPIECQARDPIALLRT